MKKGFSLVIILMICVINFAQQKQLPVHLEGLVVGASNSTVNILNQNIEKGRVPVASFPIDEKGGFVTDFTVPFSDYYVFRLENGQSLNLILLGNDTIKVYADAKSLLFNCNIVGSESSSNMKEFYTNYVPFKQFEDSLKQVLKVNPSAQGSVNIAFKPKAEQFYGYRNQFIKANTNSPALLASLTAVSQENEFPLYKQIINRLNEVFPTSPTVKMLFNQLATIENQRKAKEKLAPGNPAPEIVIPGVDGKPIKLSDLKGKIVLIDFWASWCGPCRRENPNVVKAYQKYNKDGFEVFSISFDKPGQKEKWLAAIKQDGLIWPNHGSDLNYFNSQAGRDYSVRSIPFTCLVDREGNIVATNLRGAQLEAALKQIFGY